MAVKYYWLYFGAGMLDYITLIKDWDLSYTMLARRMGMPKSTFSNKINPMQPVYRFSEAEEKQLAEILYQLAEDINSSPSRVIRDIRLVEVSVTQHGPGMGFDILK